MYKVSDAYLKARKSPVQRYRMRGTINGSVFTDQNILSGSFSISNQCSDETQVLIGQVYIAELRVTLIGFDAERYSLKNGKLIPVFGMKIEDGTFEEVPLGVYTVSDAQWGTSGIAITAYDNMSLLDRTFSAEKLTGTPYEILSLACSNCGMTMGMSEAQVQNLPNGRTEFSMAADNDITTWRDVVSWIAQTCACNAFADRQGCLVLRCYNQNVMDTIDDSHRLSGCTFGDYETRYTGLSVVNQAEEKTNYYGADKDDGLTYDLGSNPFLQNDQIRDSCCAAILSALSKIQYVPFKVTMIGDPAFDLMDVLQFTDGVADGNKISCITKFTFTYNSKFEIEGVGKNPALATRNDKSDKDLSGLISQVESVTKSINKLLYDYNTGPMEFGINEQIIGNITFYVSQQVDVEGHFLMTYTASEASHLILRFYDTTVEELFSPCEFDIIEGGGGTIGIPHAYLERLQGVHSLVVTAQCTSGKVAIDTRALFFSINAGNYVEALDDLTMDVRDISIRQLQEQNGPDQIWAIGIEDGELLVAHRDYDAKATKRPEWTSVADLGKAVDAAIEFNGYWIRRASEEVYTLVTKDQPWYFWITEDGELQAQEGEDETTLCELDTGVSSVHACRGYKSEYDLTKDQGLIVVYLKDGHVWYRQLRYFASAGVTKWDDASEVDNTITDATHCSISRLNDYRIAVTIHSASKGTKIYITDRTYVNQAVPREDIDFGIRGYNALAVYPVGYDTSIKILEQTASDDLKTLMVVYNRLFKIADGTDISGNCEVDGILKTDLPNELVQSIEMKADEQTKTSTLVVVLKEAAVSEDLKYSFSVVLNRYKGKANPNFWVKYDEWGYAAFDPLVATWNVDNTNYVSSDPQTENLVLAAGISALEFEAYPVGKIQSDVSDTIAFPAALASQNIAYIKKNLMHVEMNAEPITLPSTADSVTIEYLTKDEKPI
ncbi:MAG: hypothetical protein LKF15_00045 [Lachnospiraceae bacterium]|jgi:hypothetical protein|nr:hypothetical protein [Lachnospiraceae bacterium]MCH4027355.1 hypothetical protein [Lachnospiraceae bacterium]MCH4065195.1 hypothetical protein [Lachnospiraceae bacterium]MCH4111235.1 hypothetical protein [Lachnospiraceae bacterium]